MRLALLSFRLFCCFGLASVCLPNFHSHSSDRAYIRLVAKSDGRLEPSIAQPLSGWEEERVGCPLNRVLFLVLCADAGSFCLSRRTFCMPSR
ncbi:hypothetical protein LY78DRAFT_52115 [Colletotrichum sublineola]|nr:hypothetical protein LY78DRAFT_52115 [Colletotrichum sublineola]